MNYYEIENPQNSHFFETHQLIGVCLVAGFIFMVIVEQIFHIWKENSYATPYFFSRTKLIKRKS